ncbi:class I SAM-dependent methyltransferase [Hujiaoplasma nucleasis]|uniref:Class I SAM-dependent methyltransferase n=1 Tax=Hujiaoplasma nucleasis TaxID=2725268 RepID=A0A7L6N3B4_9MOLU|nr:class I SAM-dependent methyltransferase [Hujiaoplasma nucleasis]QLY39942.1 class I SAM-dependent methyltransferase [Hujiaoplasma nucleasis]
MKELKSYLSQYENPRILDIGTGKGDFIAMIDYVYQDYSEIIGIDIVDYLLEMDESAFENNPKIKWMDLDVLETTFPKNSFDIISLSNTLHHIKDIKSMFNQMVEMLKPGGIIILSELISSNDLSEKQISHQLLHSFAAKIDHELNKVHSQIFSKENVMQAIEMYSPLPVDAIWELETKSFDEEITLEDLYRLVDGLLKNVKDSPKFEQYKEEAIAIKDYLQENGFSYATTICVVLKKQ